MLCPLYKSYTNRRIFLLKCSTQQGYVQNPCYLCANLRSRSHLKASSVILRYITPLCCIMYRGTIDQENLVVMNNSWGSFIGGIRKPLCITSQWNFVLYLRFGLPFRMATSLCNFAKASDLFGINKFEEFHVDVLKKLFNLLLKPVKWHWGENC